MAKLLKAIIIGPPASGKGTIASKIIKSFDAFDIVHISAGDVLRMNNKLTTGFPRTRTQAEALSTKVNLDLVINLMVDKDVLLDRIKGRWIHLPSGRVYHDEYNPPKILGQDDLTGEELVQRLDDNLKSLERRLDLYYEKIPPVLNFYEETKLLHRFHGRTSDELWPHVQKCIKQCIHAKN